MKILSYLMEPMIKDVAGPHSEWKSDLYRDQGIQSKSLLIYFSLIPQSHPFLKLSSISLPTKPWEPGKWR